MMMSMTEVVIRDQFSHWEAALRMEVPRLAAGTVVITRHGKPADPDSFRGVYRLRLP